MTIRPRVIPILQISGNSAVKTTRFRRPRYVGSAINSMRIFSELEVDELVVIDLTPDAIKQSTSHFEFLSDLAAEASMPLAYGGNLRSREAVKHLVRIGFEKAILGTHTFVNPNLFGDVAEMFGSQAVVAAVDVVAGGEGYIVRSRRGAQGRSMTLEERLSFLLAAPIGEVLVTRVDLEGTQQGVDTNLVSVTVENTRVPVIINGGVASAKEAVQVFALGASAVAVGAAFVSLGGSDGTLVHVFP